MLKRYPFAFTIFNVFFLILIFAISGFTTKMPLTRLTWAIYLLFVVSTLLMHFFLTSGNTEKANVFVRKFMLATTLKLLIYLAIIVFFFMFNREMAKAFILWFLLHYTCFTVFETLMLYNTNK